MRNTNYRRLAVAVRPEIYQIFNAAAAKSGISLNEMIRQSVFQFIERKTLNAHEQLKSLEHIIEMVKKSQVDGMEVSADIPALNDLSKMLDRARNDFEQWQRIFDEIPKS